MGENKLLELDLIMEVKGTGRLKIPIVSSLFAWIGKDAASLAGHGILYILEKSKLFYQYEINVG